MIEFASWVFAMTIVCAIASAIFFIAAPDQRTTIWSVLGVVTGLTAAALGVLA